MKGRSDSGKDWERMFAYIANYLHKDKQTKG